MRRLRSCGMTPLHQLSPAGYGAYQSEQVCCSPGVAFPEGCSKRPTACWVVESFQLRTCIRDDRKCLQGALVALRVRARVMCGSDCRELLLTLALPRSMPPGFGVYPSTAACCAPGAAFPEGCNTSVVLAPQPCWVVDRCAGQQLAAEGNNERIAPKQHGWRPDERAMQPPRTTAQRAILQ
jgi:hypothetical protein